MTRSLSGSTGHTSKGKIAAMNELYTSAVEHWPILLAVVLIGACAVYMAYLFETAELGYDETDMLTPQDILDMRPDQEATNAVAREVQSGEYKIVSGSDADIVADALHQGCPPDARERDWRDCFMLDCHLVDALNVYPLLGRARIIGAARAMADIDIDDET